MDFEDYLKVNARAVEKELDKILLNFQNETEKVNPKLLPFAKRFINSCQGGKRIRGVLVKLGYELTQSVILNASEGSVANATSNKLRDSSPSAQNDIIKIGAAYEILHASLLIHDDIMDQSKTRRGQPALYRALGKSHQGISQAINMGDIGLYLTIKIITETNFSDQAKIKALKFLSETIINTGWGQVMDVALGKSTSEVNKFIRLYKTAKYTIASPLQIGAILAEVELDLLDQLDKFGSSLGIAFQIKDDILDGEVEDVDRVRLEALQYTAKAKGMIPKISPDPKLRKLLESMGEYLVERGK